MEPSGHPHDYAEVSQGSKYTFPIGTGHDVKIAILKDSGACRVTQRICDCDFPTGMGDPSAKELRYHFLYPIDLYPKP